METENEPLAELLFASQLMFNGCIEISLGNQVKYVSKVTKY